MEITPVNNLNNTSQIYKQPLDEVLRIIPFADTCKSANQFVNTAVKMTQGNPNQNDILWTLFNYFRNKAEFAKNATEQRGYFNLSNLLCKDTFYKDNTVAPLMVIHETTLSLPQKKFMFEDSLERMARNKELLVKNSPVSGYTALMGEVCKNNKKLEILGKKTGINTLKDYIIEKLKQTGEVDTIGTEEIRGHVMSLFDITKNTKESKMANSILVNLTSPKDWKLISEKYPKIKHSLRTRFILQRNSEKMQIKHLKKALKIIDKNFSQYTLENFVKAIREFRP